MNLEELKQVMSPLAAIGRGELSFELEGVPITLRTLTPEEEIAAFRYAREAVSEGEAMDRAAGMDYLDRFRAATLSYALVSAGKLDFRDVQYIETGRKLPNGTPVRVTKAEAVREVLGGWSREMMTALFLRFGDLQFQVEDRVARAVSFDEIDFDGEIARLEERITDLKEQKARRQKSEDDPRSVAMAEAARRPARLNRDPASPAPVPEEAEEARVEGEEPHAVAVPADIPRTLAPEPEHVEEASPSSVPAAPEPPRSLFGDARRGPVPASPTPPVQVQEPEPEPPEGFESSFAGPEEIEAAQQDSLRKALELSQGVARTPPHLKARAVHEQLNGPPRPPLAPGAQSRFRPAPGK